MDSQFINNLSRLPPDVLSAMMRSGESEVLDDADRLVLTNYLTTGNPPPDLAEFVGAALGAAGGSPHVAATAGYGSPAMAPTGAQDWTTTPEAAANAAGGQTQSPVNDESFPDGSPMGDYMTSGQVFEDTPQAPPPYQAVRGASINPNERFGLGGVTLPDDWRWNAPDLEMLPADSAFSDVGIADMGLYAGDPEMFAQAMAEERGAAVGGGYQRSIEPLTRDALFYASQGLLGGARNNQLNGGPSSNTGRLGMAEQMMDLLQGTRGGQVNPTAMYQKTFDRALATPEAEFDMGQGGEPGDYASQINVTNSMLVQSMGSGTTPETAEAVKNALERLARQWLSDVSRGETTLTYPQYLQSMGARDYLG